MASTLHHLAARGTTFVDRLEAARAARCLVIALQSSGRRTERIIQELETACDGRPWVATLLAIAWLAGALSGRDAAPLGQREWERCQAYATCLHFAEVPFSRTGAPTELRFLHWLIEDCAHQTLAVALFGPDCLHAPLFFAIFAATGGLAATLDMAASRPPHRTVAPARLLAAACRALCRALAAKRVVIVKRVQSALDLYSSVLPAQLVAEPMLTRRRTKLLATSIATFFLHSRLRRSELPSLATDLFCYLLRKDAAARLDVYTGILHLTLTALSFDDLGALLCFIHRQPSTYLDTLAARHSALAALLPEIRRTIARTDRAGLEEVVLPQPDENPALSDGLQYLENGGDRSL